ncbi:NYN domain-containing protein [Treponema sp. OMZ 792]|uniref:NYN domain-containing protein n=1 Tax=unclassified Treponema TaxID=2638727 RepID=UPI0020A2DE56|nr:MULTISPECIES: NYN domain-containing protein [unclassified Treponema]UTC74332.1 NYN domain-containing protein [Treponema sp. OMZ 792]UTC77384.1 NYN domain-containing protein [Treponema sp. OMZ 799]UTC80729.1 NYN domain-containing protein [Treponema sp. OMZ 798]
MGEKMCVKKRVTFYVDGFNFYYGLRRSETADKKWGNAYWINIVKLFQGFISNDEVIEKVIYFTATPLNSQKSSRQSAFLNANKMLNGDQFEIVRGKYLEKHIQCPYCNSDISKPEEKKTDVNISIRMINDCINKSTDSLVLVSADSDLIPPLELIKENFPSMKIKVLFPPSNYSNDIAHLLAAWNKKPVLMKKSYKRFENSIMNDCINKDSKKYEIPKEWKSKQTKP